jgi:hypothetical protein
MVDLNIDFTSEQQGEPIIEASVFCTLQIEGEHNWPECPYEEVSYLRSPHRHVFHVKAVAAVDHNNRDVEFILLKHNILEYLNQCYYNKERRIHVFGSKSCEMIASELLVAFNLQQVEVNEDGENGAIVRCVPNQEVSSCCGGDCGC